MVACRPGVLRAARGRLLCVGGGLSAARGWRWALRADALVLLVLAALVNAGDGDWLNPLWRPLLLGVCAWVPSWILTLRPAALDGDSRRRDRAGGR